MDMTQRQSVLLQAIVQEYIKTAKPVSSRTLVDAYGFDYSSATIRNEMAALEQAGFIVQPHTSAGRIPTELGYQYYIKHFLQQKALSTRQRRTIDEVVAEQHRQRKAREQRAREERVHLQRELVKHATKTLAELTGEAVIISVNGVGTYFTGMSHVMRQPEFSEHAELMLSIGEAFDQIDELMAQVSNAPRSGSVDVLLGRENPFSELCSMIVSDYELIDGHSGTVSILGPMRMDYDTNISIMEYIESLSDDNE